MRKLLEVLHQLVKQGNTVVVIEQNLDVIKIADWRSTLVKAGSREDRGLRGGAEQMGKAKGSSIGHYLAPVLEHRRAAAI